MIFEIIMLNYKKKKDVSIIKTVKETSVNYIDSTLMLKNEKEAFKKENAVIRKQKKKRKEKED